MKFIKSKLIKKDKYLITLEITDKDIEMIEDIALCKIDMSVGTKYDKWVKKLFKTFQKLWKKYDDYRRLYKTYSKRTEKI